MRCRRPHMEGVLSQRFLLVNVVASIAICHGVSRQHGTLGRHFRFPVLALV